MSCDDFHFAEPEQILLALGPGDGILTEVVTAVFTEIIVRNLGLDGWFEGSDITQTQLQTLAQELLQDTDVATQNRSKLACATENISSETGCGCTTVGDKKDDFQEWQDHHDNLRSNWNAIGGGLVPGRDDQSPCYKLAQAMNNRLKAFHECQLSRLEESVLCNFGPRPSYCREPSMVQKCVRYEGEEIPITETADSNFWDNALNANCQICSKNSGKQMAAGSVALNAVMIAGEHFSQLLGCGTQTQRIEASTNRCRYISTTLKNIATFGDCPKKCAEYETVPGFKFKQC